MYPFFNLMNFINQVRQIKQNPNYLATILQQRGMIGPQQAQDIQRMGGDYEQIGHYLMKQGRMPNNVEQYQQEVEQIQNMMR